MESKSLPREPHLGGGELFHNQDMATHGVVSCSSPSSVSRESESTPPEKESLMSSQDTPTWCRQHNTTQDSPTPDSLNDHALPHALRETLMGNTDQHHCRNPLRFGEIPCLEWPSQGHPLLVCKSLSEMQMSDLLKRTLPNESPMWPCTVGTGPTPLAFKSSSRTVHPQGYPTDPGKGPFQDTLGEISPAFSLKKHYSRHPSQMTHFRTTVSTPQSKKHHGTLKDNHPPLPLEKLPSDFHDGWPQKSLQSSSVSRQRPWGKSFDTITHPLWTPRNVKDSHEPHHQNSSHETSPRFNSAPPFRIKPINTHVLCAIDPVDVLPETSLEFNLQGSCLVTSRKTASPHFIPHTSSSCTLQSVATDRQEQELLKSTVHVHGKMSTLLQTQWNIQQSPKCAAIRQETLSRESLDRFTDSRSKNLNLHTTVEPGQDSTGSSAPCLIDSLSPKQYTTIHMQNLGVTFCVEPNGIHPNGQGHDKDDPGVLNGSVKEIAQESHFGCFSTFTHFLHQACRLAEMLTGLRLVPRTRRVPEKLIQGLHGTFLPGRLVAILGPSGSGKSTLLNVLAGRLPHTEGHLRVNGMDRRLDHLKKYSAFIQQIDLFLPNITVEEHLKAQVQLRLRHSLTEKERDTLVQDVMTKFGLFKVRHHLIGSTDVSYGISGGERKRLSVATALLSNPLILLADEPTTGLDSVMAKSVIAALRCIAASGRTVIASLHQPTTQTFSMFDEVLLLAGGRTIYFGDRLGSVEWMKRLGVFCSNLTNPSDFLIRCVSLPDNPQKRLEKKLQLHQWAKLWEAEGDHFLRQWTQGGRLAFFLSSRSFTERSIELGLLSLPSPETQRYSAEQSLTSFPNEAFSNTDRYFTGSFPASTQFEDPHTLSETKYPFDRFLDPDSFEDQRNGQIIINPPWNQKNLKPNASAEPLARRSADMESSFHSKPMGAWKGKKNIAASNTSLVQDLLNSGIPSTLHENHDAKGPKQFFSSFHSAPAVASFPYALQASHGLSELTRQKIASRGTRNLLKTFRYSGPRPWGHSSNFSSDQNKLHYLSCLGKFRSNAASLECSCDAIMGKPVSLCQPYSDDLYMTGVPSTPAPPKTDISHSSHPLDHLPMTRSRFISLSQPYTTELSVKPLTPDSGLKDKKALKEPPLTHVTLTRLVKPGDIENALPYEFTRHILPPALAELQTTQDGDSSLSQYSSHTFWYQLRVLTARALLSNRRDPILLYARALQTFIIALMYGSMFFNLKDSFDDARTKVSALFFVLTNQGLLGAAGVCSTFPDEKVVISREQESGFVNSKAYILAKMLADIPIQCIFPILFNVVTMWMMNLCSSWSKMLLSCLVALAVCNCAIAIGYLGSAAASSSDIALVIAQIWVLPALLFSGFIVILNDIPKFISWLQFLSYFRYGFIAYTHLIFDQAQIIYQTPTEITVMSGNTFIQSYLGITIGETSKFWIQVMCLVLMTIVLRFIIILAIAPLTKTWKEKPS